MSLKVTLSYIWLTLVCKYNCVVLIKPGRFINLHLIALVVLYGCQFHSSLQGFACLMFPMIMSRQFEHGGMLISFHNMVTNTYMDLIYMLLFAWIFFLQFHLFSMPDVYRNFPKFSDRQDRQVWANSVDPDQTAPSASFGCITLRKSHLVQLLGWLQHFFFLCPNI